MYKQYCNQNWSNVVVMTMECISLTNFDHFLLPLLQLDLVMNNDLGEGDTSTFVLNGEWHLLGNRIHPIFSMFYYCHQNQWFQCILPPFPTLYYNTPLAVFVCTYCNVTSTFDLYLEPSLFPIISTVTQYLAELKINSFSCFFLNVLCMYTP